MYEQKSARAATVIRADASLRIYQHSLRLHRVVDSKDSSTTMMTADMDRIQQGVRKLHDAWASLASVGIGLWLITIELGVMSLATLAMIGGEQSTPLSPVQKANLCQVLLSLRPSGPDVPVNIRKLGWKPSRDDYTRRCRCLRGSRPSNKLEPRNLSTRHLATRGLEKSSCLSRFACS